MAENHSKHPASETINEEAPLLVDGPSDSSPHTSLHNTDTQPSTQLTTSNLVRFRSAIGINVSSQSSNPHELEAARLKPSGLYRQIISTQRSRNRQYYIFEYFYYAALIGQILIGSILAALGSLAAIHPMVITVLGVINTSIAGILALMKGQGLPDRLRKDAYEMKKVQDYIEETDIRLAIEEDIHPHELEIVVQNVFDMYNTARDTAEMNHPTNYAHQVAGPGTDDQGQGRNGNGNARNVGHDGTEDDSVGVMTVNRMARIGSQAQAKFVIS